MVLHLLEEEGVGAIELLPHSVVCISFVLLQSVSFAVLGPVAGSLVCLFEHHPQLRSKLQDGDDLLLRQEAELFKQAFSALSILKALSSQHALQEQANQATAPLFPETELANDLLAVLHARSALHEGSE